MPDDDLDLARRLSRLSAAVPVPPGVAGIERGPIAARQRVRNAWLLPLVFLVVIGAVVGGRGVLSRMGWPAPTDGPIELLTARSSEGTVCGAARGGGWLARNEHSGLGVTDRAGSQARAVKWPVGYWAKLEGGRAVLLDPTGRVVAREGDQIQFGGSGGQEYFFACSGIEVVRETPPVATDVSAVARADTGPYAIELRSAKRTYRESEIIDVTGLFTYSGGTEIEVQGFKPLVFGVAEPVYGIDMNDLVTLECNHETLQPGERFEAPFHKGGGVSTSDPEYERKRAYLMDPVLRLPPGTWHLRLAATLYEDDCGSARRSLATEIEIVVLPD